MELNLNLCNVQNEDCILLNNDINKKKFIDKFSAKNQNIIILMVIFKIN